MDRIALIVDTDLATRARIAGILAQATPSYRVVEVGSEELARFLIARLQYALAIIGLPADEGLALMDHARRLDRRLPLVLLRDAGFTHSQVLQIVRLGARVAKRSVSTNELRALVGEIDPYPAHEPAPLPILTFPPLPHAADKIAQAVINTLREQCQTTMALYTDHLGQIIAHSGKLEGRDMTAISSLAAGGFTNTHQLAQQLDESATFNLMFHEGRVYDIYAINCGQQRMLVQIVDKRQSHPKLGAIWQEMKRAAQHLIDLGRANKPNNSAINPDLLSNSLNAEFDRLFGGELSSTPRRRQIA
ncbi:MAG: hypothetical protein OHK0050_28390 [Roseiflexaceae bacterium]